MIPFPGPRWCLTPDAMAAVDRAAIVAGLPGSALMESAGRGVAEFVLDRRPERVVVLAGGGSNGGDGFVAARHLAAAGVAVEIALFADPDELRGDAAGMWRALESARLPARRVADPEAARAAIGAASTAGVVIDALLGTGLSGEVREPIRAAVEALAHLDVPVVSVDIPSGVSGATGEILGAAVQADATVTFGFPKPGLFLREGPERAGRLVVVGLGYPPVALAAAGADPLEWVGLLEAERALPPRRHDLHKGDAGRLLLLAGSARYPGAAILSAGAALRSGAGLVVVATPAGVAAALRDRYPEAIVVELPERRSGGLAPQAAERVAEAAGKADALALGPGLTTDAGVREAVEAALSGGAPAVVDADALNVLAADPAPVRRAPATFLTPHPGELGRWLDRPAAEVDADRVEA
ncbi:MAG TPA: NAD(P)H-hydrate epimerase, partial [Gemmatimonadota bacterium]|nr:NAD(P)H-hydrate epimerase [Gemmatimonadota bacterium]